MSVPPPSVAPPVPPSTTVPLAPCDACGQDFDMRAATCPRCDFPRGGASTLGQTLGGRSARKAWWLSLAWPGLGHIYARDTHTGAIFCGVSALVCLLSATVIGPTLGVIVWLALALHTALDSGRALEIRQLADPAPAERQRQRRGLARHEVRPGRDDLAA